MLVIESVGLATMLDSGVDIWIVDSTSVFFRLVCVYVCAFTSADGGVNVGSWEVGVAEHRLAFAVF